MYKAQREEHLGRIQGSIRQGFLVKQESTHTELPGPSSCSRSATMWAIRFPDVWIGLDWNGQGGLHEGGDTSGTYRVGRTEID